MAESELDVVTGAYNYTGKYVTRRLLARNRRVLALTSAGNRPNPFGAAVRAVPYQFDRPEELAASLRGATRLFNTYWVRFAHGHVTHASAVENSKTLFRAAQAAGVRRIVHISITNPSEDSPLSYFRGKAEVERFLRELGTAHTILRPAVLFGGDDPAEGILLNNIAWLLRHIFVFLTPGRGDYQLQPIHVEDLADLMVQAGDEPANRTLDAVGPETFTFDELVRRIARAIGSHQRIIHVPPTLALWTARLFGWFMGDVMLTRDEVRGLMTNLLISPAPPTGSNRLSDWLTANGPRLGIHYASELQRHYR